MISSFDLFSAQWWQDHPFLGAFGVPVSVFAIAYLLDLVLEYYFPDPGSPRYRSSR